jgi:hypothetical protein
MSLLNQLANALANWVLAPWAGQSPWVALAFVSLLAAGVMVALFHVSSDQQALRRGRDRFIARLLELLLFQHDLRVNLSACGRIFQANLSYLGALLRPMLVATVPLAIIFIQLACWFEWRPLKVGETAVLEVELDKSHPVAQTDIKLTAPAIARIDSSGVRSLAINELAWRLRATGPGSGPIAVRVAGTTEFKELAVGQQLSRIAPLRVAPGFWNQLLQPSEPSLPAAGPIRRIEITYPPRQLLAWGHEVHWTIVAVVLMMLFGLLIGRLFGVRVA